MPTHPTRLRIPSLAVIFLFAAATASSALAAPPKADRQSPTTPKNLRVTGMTPYSISLAWDASTDNSGSFVYRICCTNVNSETVSAPASSFTYRKGVEANRPFSLRMFAVDAAGNASGYSNIVSGTTPPDTIPPTKPVVTVTEVGATHISLAWSSIEEGPVWFTVVRDDNTIVVQGTRETSGTAYFLEPETTYTFRAQARDFSGKSSPVSDPVTATTAPRNTNDTTAPSTPANFGGSNFDTETWLSWDQSTDDVTPQSRIRYEIYLNGALDHGTVGRGSTILYGTAGIINTFEVVAVDEAGNKSGPASFTIDMR